MIVITDTSSLNYRVLIGEADLLNKLDSRVLIPEAVLSEWNKTFLLSTNRAFPLCGGSDSGFIDIVRAPV